MSAYKSSKFHYATRQYRFDGRRHTLLRLTAGKTGCAIKTATARDNNGPPTFQDSALLIEVFDWAVNAISRKEVDVSVRRDGKGRFFAEVTGTGCEQDAVDLTEEICALVDLGLFPETRALALGRVEGLHNARHSIK